MTGLILAAIGIIICIYMSGYFSSTEIALTSVNEVRMENEAEDGNKRAQKVLRILDKFDNALSAILIGNNLVNIAASALTSVFMLLLMGTDRWTFIGTIVVTILVIIFGETIPKITAKMTANTTAMKNSSVIWMMMTVLKPFIALIVWLVELITSGMKDESEEPDDEESVEELHSIIDTAEDEGVIDADQSEIVQAAIDFSSISAFEVMTARVDIDAINVEDSVEEILAEIEDSPYTRFPVYEDSIDNIIGTLHLNHLLRAMSEDEDVDLRSLLMPPCFVYKTMKLPKVLNTLKSAKQHLAVVTDEYSGTLGVISMEDVLEQIVGDIWDETDEVEPELIRADETSFEVDGDMIIDDFLELTGINSEEFDYMSDTIGGFCIEYLEKFPKAGDHFTYEDYEIYVEEVDDRRVTRVLAKRIPGDTAGE
ncbi:MAG: HlyC/CorC family transporter [Oscillospiraceae bacterium]|nr:HlyC/CorC family transporter [Oscillospiraceae bacterium]